MDTEPTMAAQVAEHVRVIDFMMGALRTFAIVHRAEFSVEELVSLRTFVQSLNAPISESLKPLAEALDDYEQNADDLDEEKADLLLSRFVSATRAVLGKAKI